MPWHIYQKDPECQKIYRFCMILIPKHKSIITIFYLFCRGEISVVCQDIKLIKEKFDQHVPLSKLLSSSYTLASLTSSSSSIPSTAPQQMSELVHALDSIKALDRSIADDQISYGEEVPSHQKELIDDGWEFFNKEECRT